MLTDFLNEISQKMLKIKIDFKTSNDEKAFFAGIKNFTGNAVNDEQLLKYGTLSDKDFLDEIAGVFHEKKKEKINLISAEQYNDLEKKIFYKY